MEFNAGDVVCLKSGGPSMTVTGVIGKDPQLNILKSTHGFQDGDVTVEYFNDSNKLERGTFKQTSLELME